jgi:hypothetical protein
MTSKIKLSCIIDGKENISNCLIYSPFTKRFCHCRGTASIICGVNLTLEEAVCS